MSEKRFLAWKSAFADCLRFAIRTNYFSDYEWFLFGASGLKTDENLEIFYKEEEEAFQKIFGESLW